ncbi:MAG: DMT family transporter [Alphaproteobacteria bacterium]|nr:DMT family transporter [Alphaproteobacteria bacterium]MBF0129719.1 DMT family transporter [Alphaproteobacteria bacterium]
MFARLSPWLENRLSANVRGAIWLSLAAVLFSLMSAGIKVLGADFDSFEIVFFRCLFGLLTLTPFLWRYRTAALVTRQSGLHAIRIAFGIVTMFATFYALTHMHLATATAVFFANTLFVIPIAVAFLNESVHWRRWLATLVGFGGVMMILRPGPVGIDLASLSAIVAAVSGAGVLTLLKKLSATEKPLTTMLWFTLVSVPVTFVPALMVWKTPDLGQLGLLALVGALGSGGQYLAIRAYGAGEATAVSPFNYLQLPLSGILGVLVFAESPDAWTWAGSAVILAANLYLCAPPPALSPDKSPDKSVA